MVAAGAVAQAQPAPPPAKPENAEAAAAMERAQRLAANPMRAILQAGKIKRRVEPEAAVPAPTGTSVVTSAGVAAATRSTAEPAPAALMKLADTLPGSASAEPVARLEASPTLAAPPPLQALPQTPEVLDAAPPPLQAQRPSLVKLVEPNVPGQLLAEVGRSVEVYADLSLRADGTVAEVSLLAPYPRTWQRYLLAALSQWRFEPLPGPSVHRVQLVFNEPR